MSEDDKEVQQPETPTGTEELSEKELDQTAAGIGMLLPAVQKVRDA